MNLRHWSLSFVFLSSNALLAFSPLTAALDLRPSWSPQKSEVRAENEMALAYQVNDQIKLSYVQEFNAPFGLKSGYLKTENTITKRLRVENRIFLPTDPAERELTFNGGFRPIVAYTLWGDESRGIELSESVVARWYREALENSSYENRVELVPFYSLFQDRLALKLPLVWQLINNRTSWDHLLWINPEVTYAVDEHVRVGVAYYSESFTRPNGMDIISAFQQGTIQMVMQASL